MRQENIPQSSFGNETVGIIGSPDKIAGKKACAAARPLCALCNLP